MLKHYVKSPVVTFEMAAQLEPGTIMRVNRAVGTEVLLHGRLIRDAKVITARDRGSTPGWTSAADNIVITVNSLCMITRLSIEEGKGVFADLVCFERVGDLQRAVLLEALDLDHGNTHYQFFDATHFIFNLNRVYEKISNDHQVKRLRAGTHTLDLDVNNCQEMWWFLYDAANVDVNGNVHGVDLDVYAQYVNDQAIIEEREPGFSPHAHLSTAGCGCGGCCKFPDPNKPGGCICGCECEDCKQHRRGVLSSDTRQSVANNYLIGA